MEIAIKNCIYQRMVHNVIAYPKITYKMWLPKRKSIEKCVNLRKNQQTKSLKNKNSTEDTKITITKKNNLQENDCFVY
jgi:hypothetical protein